MRILFVVSLCLGTLCFAQTPFSLDQTWHLNFEDARGWQVTLTSQTQDGFGASAKSPSFGPELETSVGELDEADKAFLGLTGDYVAFMLTYPTGIVSPSGDDIVVCTLPKGDLTSGQVFGLRQQSTGVALNSGGGACSAQLVTDTVGSSWPPQLNVGETWQLSVLQGGSQIAAWTLALNGLQEGTVVGDALGTDERLVEAAFFAQEAPQPQMTNSWVLALSSPSDTPLYCIFTQEKPFTERSMTGSMMLASATCEVTRLE